MKRATASARTPSFSHLKNTHPGCFGVPEVSRSTFRVQSSHSMSGIGKPQRRCASAEPGGRPDESMPANLRRRRADELAPACGDAWAVGEAPRPLHSLGQQPAAGKSQIRRPAMKCRRSANPAARRRRGEGEASCAWRPSGVLLPAAVAGILGGGRRRRERGEERWLVGESAG